MQRKALVIFSVVVTFLLILVLVFLGPRHIGQIKKADASTAASVLSTQVQWDLGTKSNADTSTGQIKMSDAALGGTKFDLNALYQQSPGSFQTYSRRVTETNSNHIFDGDLGTSWTFTDVGTPISPIICGYPSGATWSNLIVDLGASYNFSSARAYMSADSFPLNPSYDTFSVTSSNSYTPVSCPTGFISAYEPWGVDVIFDQPISATADTWQTKPFIANNVRYLAIDAFFPLHEIIKEIELYTNFSATHTSSPTQIDGSEGATKNFIAWETFTPTYNEPANTNVQFRFRTSPDHATWTAWSGYQTPASAAPLDISAIVDSASGANKYLQVETTLENTDGASTPSVDSYSVQYHTDVKPTKPTAASAVVQ